MAKQLLTTHALLRKKTHSDFSFLNLTDHIQTILWQARRDSNPQPSDLESAALPLELLTYFNDRRLYR